MSSRRPARYDHWSTGTKLLVLLSLALFPLGLALAWTARMNLLDAEGAIVDASYEDGKVAARAAESLVARNALALRVAANGAIKASPATACQVAAQSLALTPSIANRFSLHRSDGTTLCTTGNYVASSNDVMVAPGAIALWIAPETGALRYRVGVNDGMATGELTAADLARSVREASPRIGGFTLSDGKSTINVFGIDEALMPDRVSRYEIARGQLTATVRSPIAPSSVGERMAIFLQLLMWVDAALLIWFLTRRLLLLPLARLQRAVTEYQPGEGALVIPEKLGSAEEIRSLGGAFERAVDRLENSEQQMAEALHGQRRLVREVHHRVKNNLQVIASLLNFQGRSATTPESRAAYAAIGRRVDALSVVHRNHFAEVEESRGIALRPLLTELGQTLRASAPEGGISAPIHLNADALHTTQDAAVAVAFFVTELIEYAMLRGTAQPIEIELRRISELAASLTVSSDALMADNEQPNGERQQFERVIGGLARQLRSPLEQKLGRLSVNLPVFPD
jgi:two-component sensor histidine kinase